MKITGYQIREQLRQLDLRLKTLYSQFEESLTKFEDENKALPSQIDEQIVITERTVAQLQEVQAHYNLEVRLEVGRDHFMTLLEAVKLVGSAGRREKMWRSVAAPQKDRYGISDHSVERDPTKKYAIRQVSREEAGNVASKAARFAGQLRAAIAAGNATVIDLDVDPKLFES